MLHLGTDARLDLLHLVYQRVNGVVLFVQRSAFAWAHRDVPPHCLLGIRALVDTLVARITKPVCLLPVQQAVALYNVGHVTRGAYDGMHESRVRIHADMGLHAKVPFVALLARMHLWIALSVLVLGRARRCDQCGIDRSACLEQQALGCQKLVDSGQNLLGQLVFLQPMTKPQDGALVRHPPMGIKTCKLPVDRGVKEGLFHRQI